MAIKLPTSNINFQTDVSQSWKDLNQNMTVKTGSLTEKKEPSQTTTSSMPVEQLSEPPATVPSFTSTSPSSNSGMLSTLNDIKTKAGLAQSALNTIKAQETPATTGTPTAEPTSSRDQYLQNYIDSATTNLADEKQAIRDEALVAQKKERALSLYNEILQDEQDHRKRLKEIRKNPDGKLRGALDAELYDAELEFSEMMANKSITYNIALGDYEAASAAVESRIADIEADLTRRTDMWKTAFEFAGDTMTDEEELQARQKFESDMLDKQQTYDKELAKYKYELDALYNPPTVSTGSSAPKIVEVNGVDMIWDEATGKYIPAPVAGASSSMTLARSEDKLDQWTGLLTDPGMKKAVGTTKLARWTPFKADVMSGDVSNFIGTVDSLTKGLTIDTLVEAKANGATFGALNAQEFSTIADSATKINSWRRTSGDGDNVKTSHFAASERDFKKEVDRLVYFAKKDYLLKGGDPAKASVLVQDDGTYWTKNSDNTYSQITF